MADARTGQRPRIVATMGTVIGIDVRDPDVPETAVEAAVAWLTDVDARFSPYRAASEISRLARGEIGADDCAPDVRFVLTRCEALRLESDGFFDIRGAGLIGGLDPSGCWSNSMNTRFQYSSKRSPPHSSSGEQSVRPQEQGPPQS